MTDQNKHMDDLIRKSFSENAQEWDGSGFDAISEKLDASASVDQLVQSAFADAAVELEDVQWDSMQDKLDIETVWTGLNEELTAESQLKQSFWLQIAAVVFICLFPFSLKNPIQEESWGVVDGESEIVEIENEISEQPIVLVENENDNSGLVDAIQESNANQNNLFVETNSNAGQEDKIAVSNGSESNQEENDVNVEEVNVPGDNSSTPEREENTDVLALHAIGLNLLDQAVSSNPLSGEKENIHITKPRAPKPVFKVGVFATMDNTWLMNQETADGFKKSSLVINSTKFTHNYGLFGEVNWANGLVLKSNLFIRSRMNQQKEKYREGYFIRENTELNYLKMSLQAGYRFDFGKKANQFINLNGGPYFSYLRNAEIRIDDYITTTSESFKRFDAGVQLDLLHGFKVKQFELFYGASTSYGLMNVYQNTNQGKNLSAGLILGASYRF